MSIDKIIDTIETLIPTIMQTNKIPSLAIGVTKGNKLAYSNAFGSKNLKQNLHATTDTLYGIGSCTKSFTTLAILQLAQKKKLHLEDPIEKYIPIRIGLEEHPITIKHLMSHSSGIPDLGTAIVLINRLSMNEETYIPMSNFEELIRYINDAQNEIADIPSKRFFYNNTAFALLGLIIENVTNEPYENYIKNNILMPLEMERSIFHQEEFVRDDDKVTAYYLDKNNNLIDTNHPFDDLIYAAGGLLSSVNDLTNYLIMCLNDGIFKGKEIMSPEMIKQWWEPQIEMMPKFYGKQNYAFGWATVDDFFGERIIEHGGSTAVSSAMISMIPKKKFGVVVLGNVGNCQGGLITQIILASLLGKDPTNDLPAMRLNAKLKKFVGDYQTYRGINKFSIKKQGLNLIGKYGEASSYSLTIIPESDKFDDYNFYIPIGTTKFPIYFEENKDSKQIDLFYERSRFHKIS